MNAVSRQEKRDPTQVRATGGDIELLELIAKDPQAFILKQCWASVSPDGARGLMEPRSLYGHLQARILEMIETLDEVRASAGYEVFRAAEEIEELTGSSPF